VLTDDRGSTEVENAYLTRYRRSLKSDVQSKSPPLERISARDSY
jgi:hypothetical protein